MNQSTKTHNTYNSKEQIGFLERVSQVLDQRKRESGFRRLREVYSKSPDSIVVENRELINFASNDYMGLSWHPLLTERSKAYIDAYGAGSASARLLGGNNAIIERVENKLANLKGSQAALIFPTGYQLNSSLITMLVREASFSALDKLCHASMLANLKEDFRNGRCKRFKNNDSSDLNALLKKHAPEKAFDRWIITESVFGMDGSLFPKEEIIALSKTHESCLYVDEAHATGVFGENGMGLFKADKQTTIAMGTFGKGAGCFGAYIACSKQVKEYVINCLPGFIYTTSLPPSTIGAIDASLDLIPTMEKSRSKLLERAFTLRQNLRKLGFSTGTSQSQIIPVIVGDSVSALGLSSYLENNGIFAPAIRYPTVSKNLARVRISLCSAHTEEHLNHLLKSLAKWKKTL